MLCRRNRVDQLHASVRTTMSETIWLYWEGPMPPLIRLCCQTVFAHYAGATLLDRAGFEKLFISDRDIDIDVLALNHKSDFIRAYLLKHFGGIYLDADCIVMRNLSPLLEKAKEYGFVGYRERPGYMSCNLMAAEASGSIITDHYERVCETLRSGRSLAWLDLASVPMDQAVALHPAECCLLPTEAVMPICWSESNRFCERRCDEEHARFLNADALCYMLSHNTIRSRLQTRVLCYMPESALLNDRYFISFLFRQILAKG